MAEELVELSGFEAVSSLTVTKRSGDRRGLKVIGGTLELKIDGPSFICDKAHLIEILEAVDAKEAEE